MDIDSRVFIPTSLEMISRKIMNKPEVPRMTVIIVNNPRILIKYILLIEEYSSEFDLEKDCNCL